jgi:hypothetical protein
MPINFRFYQLEEVGLLIGYSEVVYNRLILVTRLSIYYALYILIALYIFIYLAL